jgi:hypothetical protein
MNLFIDTNIFLDFYHLSGADIEELHKLTALLESGGLKLFITDQLCDEFKRNRDNKINDAMNAFNKPKLTIIFPAFCKLYPEYAELQIMLKEANTKQTQLYNKAMADVDAVKLKADTVIGELFGNATLVVVSDKIYMKALRRFRMGNPPGKKGGTIGDEVNWEALLEEVPNGEDLYFVSRDSDYAAAIDPYKFNPFLDKEWSFKKGGGASIFFYKSIQNFFKAKYPEIKLASDVKKNALIEALAKSGTFATTHLVVEKLNQIVEFSPTQVEQLIQIAHMNKQVWWIMGDTDVLAFYLKLRDEHSNNISVESLEALTKLISEEEKKEAKELKEPDDDDIPF